MPPDGNERRVRLALEQVLAGELGDRLAVAGRGQERVVLLGGGAGHRHEPVGVVGGAVRHRPLLHAVRDRVDDRRVERLVAVDRAAQLLEDRLGEVLALGVLVEHVLAVDVLAGVLEVVLGGGDPVVGDRRRWPWFERSWVSCRRWRPGAGRGADAGTGSADLADAGSRSSIAADESAPVRVDRESDPQGPRCSRADVRRAGARQVGDRGVERRAARAGPPRRHEVVQQPPELAPDVHVAVRADTTSASRPSASRRAQTRRRGIQNVISSPTIRQPERRSRRSPAPGRCLAISSVYSPKSRSSTREVRAVGRARSRRGSARAAPGPRCRRSHPGSSPTARNGSTSSTPAPVGRRAGAGAGGPTSRPGTANSANGKPAACVGHRDRAGPQRAGRPRRGSRGPAPARSRSGGTCSPPTVERVVDPDRLLGDLLAVLVDREVAS